MQKAITFDYLRSNTQDTRSCIVDILKHD